MKSVFDAEIIGTECLTPGIFSTWLSCPGADFAEVKPGQFVGVFPNDPSALLPRPISLCETDAEKKTVRLVYRTAGKGTAELSGALPGQSFRVLGFLGNGYRTDALRGKHAVLFGGGRGIPPMLELAKELRNAGEGRITAVLGYRGAESLFLDEEFGKYCDAVIISTDDGSTGIHGTVIDAAELSELRPDVVCACGPMPMLRGIKAYAARLGVQAFLSLEERMACGVGVCLGCVCRTAHKDAHSNVNNARICTEGPVFDAAEVEI